MKSSVFAITLFIALTTLSVFSSASDDAEIQQLISTLENSGCQFTRNGSTHSAANAADHLRLKLRNGKKWVHSTEQFIERLATKSSWSGKAYTVNCGGGEEASGDWLMHQLLTLRKASHKPA